MSPSLPFFGLRPPEPPLADDTIQLRPPRDADVPAIADACRDPEIARWIPIPTPYLAADARAFVAFAAEGWAGRREATLVIVERRTGAVVGTVAYRPIETGRGAIGYWLVPDARGRGLVSRAVRLVAAWAFHDPSLQRLELMTLVGNDASGRVALRCGFTHEGRLHRYLRFRDRMVDIEMYALLRGEPGSGT